MRVVSTRPIVGGRVGRHRRTRNGPRPPCPDDPGHRVVAELTGTPGSSLAFRARRLHLASGTAWRPPPAGTTRPARTRRYARGIKGDRVEVVVAADDGSRTYEIVATRAGRRVEITTGRGIVEVVEVTRTGEPVRTARFMASRVVALVEHPANEDRKKRELSKDAS
jgi:hypothetical protein